MAHGTPDWKRSSGIQTTYQISDVGESAARLGSIDRFDRRGDAVNLEDYEGSIAHWNITTAGLGAGVTRVVTHARSPTHSAQLVGGSNGAAYALLGHGLPVPVNSQLGVELHFCVEADILEFRLIATLYDGVNVQYAHVRYLDADPLGGPDLHYLQYFDAGGGWTTIATGIDLSKTANLFHALKLVWDPVTPEFVRCILDSTEYNLAGIAVNTALSAVQPYLLTAGYCGSRAGNNDTVWLDDVIVTQNEP